MELLKQIGRDLLISRGVDLAHVEDLSHILADEIGVVLVNLLRYARVIFISKAVRRISLLFPVSNADTIGTNGKPHQLSYLAIWSIENIFPVAPSYACLSTEAL